MTSSWSSSNARDSGEVQPSDVDIVRMIQLGEGRLPSSKDKHCWDLHSQAQLAVIFIIVQILFCSRTSQHSRYLQLAE